MLTEIQESEVDGSIRIIRSNKDRPAISNKHKKDGVFGYELIINLKDCDPKVISSEEALRKYVLRVCKLIRMKRYGETQLHHFGYGKPQTKGYSLIQFIETSSIIGHFSELCNSAYLNIFSCKDFNSGKVIKFTRKYFKCGHSYSRVVIR